MNGLNASGSIGKGSSAVATIAICVSALTFSYSASAESVSDFYHGKIIRIIIGSTVGGGYGLYSQLAARHFGKFVPGSPQVIIESRPGASGLLALNYLGTAAPRDGTVITLAHVTIAQEGLFNPNAKFDPAQFRFIGRIGGLVQIGMASRQSGVKTLDDARKRDVIAGAVGSFDVTSQLPQIMNKMAGTQFKIITGYPGTTETYLALERGEVELAATSLDSIQAMYWNKYQSGEFVPIIAFSRERLPEFPDVPTIMEFGKTDLDKAFLKIFMLASDIGRSLAAPPGVPEDRVAALRAAYDKMIDDADFKADAAKVELKLAPVSGTELDRLVAEATEISPKRLSETKQFYDSLQQGLREKSNK